MAQTQLTRIELLDRQIKQIADLIIVEMRADYQNIIAILAKIEQELNAPAPDDDMPVSGHIIAPKYRDMITGKEVFMPQSLMNDLISTLPVEFDNLAGKPVPAPAAGAITVSLVDADGALSPLGTAVLAADGVSVDVIPASPPGSALGDATVVYDDVSGTADSPSDISFRYDVTFTDDPTATSAHVDSAHITTRPMEAAPAPPTGP